MSSIQTNRARCTLYKKILIFSTRKSFLERAVVELVYKFDKKSYCECLKRCRSLKYDSNFFCPQTYIYTYNIYGHQPPWSHMHGKIKIIQSMNSRIAASSAIQVLNSLNYLRANNFLFSLETVNLQDVP